MLADLHELPYVRNVIVALETEVVWANK